MDRTRSTRRLSIMVTALVSLTALFAVVTPDQSRAVLPGENGRIVLISGRPPETDATARLYLLPVPSNSSGGGLISAPIVPAGGQYRHPTWSPDRTKIAFANGSPADGYDLFVIDLEAGTGPVQMAHAGRHGPDGAHQVDAGQVHPPGQVLPLLARRAGGSRVAQVGIRFPGQQHHGPGLPQAVCQAPADSQGDVLFQGAVLAGCTGVGPAVPGVYHNHPVCHRPGLSLNGLPACPDFAEADQVESDKDQGHQGGHVALADPEGPDEGWRHEQFPLWKSPFY